MTDVIKCNVNKLYQHTHTHKNDGNRKSLFGKQHSNNCQKASSTNVNISGQKLISTSICIVSKRLPTKDAY